MVVVATDSEYKIAKKRYKHQVILKTGVGACNVIKKLRRIPKFITITNFGYCGSNTLPIGTECKIGKVATLHESVDFDDIEYRLDGNVDCYTSCDFVTETQIIKPCVFDMELAFILALGFKKVKSIKIVSDNLSTHQYYQTIKEPENV